MLKKDMTKEDPSSNAFTGIREAVRSIPAYPFVPSNVPHKLDQNEHPYDFPSELKQKALERALNASWNRYPELHADKLRGHIGEYENWDPKGIVITAGSNMLIKLLIELAGIGQSVIAADPTFPVYNLETLMLGGTLRKVPLNSDFSLPAEGLKAEIEAATQAGERGMVYIIQPHAPTGYLDSEDIVKDLVEYADERGWFVLMDEAYYQYGGTDYRDLVRESPRRMSIRTFSKAWGLAHLRAGYLLTSPEIAENLIKLVPAFNINCATQAVIEVALENDSYMKEGVKQLNAERERVLAALADHPTCTAHPSKANFFLLRTPDSVAAYNHLMQQGIITRSQSKLTGLEGCLRVSIGTPADNDALIAAVKSYR